MEKSKGDRVFAQGEKGKPKIANTMGLRVLKFVKIN